MIKIAFQNFNSHLNSRINKTPPFILPLILFCICALVFSKLHHGYNTDFRPQGVHFWAQADRFSIARNYYDNGLNFFEPQTNYLELNEGKTGVEFPAIQYATALIAKPFGARDSLFLIYRSLCFLFLSIGALFLMKTIKIHGGNAFQQVLIPVFFILSPLLLFYGFNLLPDVPAFALTLISYYYFETFRLNIKFNAIYYALAFGFAAALLKITSAIFPIAYLFWVLTHSFFIDKQISRSKIRFIIVFFVAFFSIWLSITYYFTVRANAVFQSSVFLSMSRHINDWGNFSEIWESIVCWHREYFRETQYWIILIAFIVSLNTRYKNNGVLWFKTIVFIGFICFILLMGKQLINHDYYAICTIIPVIIILSLDGLMILSKGCIGALFLLYFVQNIAPQSIQQSIKRQDEVYNLPCREIWDYKAYMIEGAQWVANTKIPKSDIIFVLYDYPLNTPLVYLDRKGMVFNHFKMKDKSLINYWFNQLKPKYIVIPKQWTHCLKEDQIEITKTLEMVFQGNQVTIYKSIR